MEIPRQVSPSKETSGRNGVGGEGIDNCKILNKRKTYKEKWDFLKTFWGEAGDKYKKQTASKKRPRMLHTTEQLKKNDKNIQKSRLASEVFKKEEREQKIQADK